MEKLKKKLIDDDLFIKEGSRIRIPSLNLEGYIIKRDLKNGRIAICNINFFVPSKTGNFQNDVNAALSSYLSQSKTLRKEIKIQTFSGILGDSQIKLLSKKDLNAIKFAIGGQDNIQSWIWRMWVARDDVYLGAKNAFKVFKVSLHESGIWRIAFTSDLNREDNQSDRAIVKWNKPGEFTLGWTPSIGILISSIDAKRPFKKIPVIDPAIEWFPPPEKNNKLVFKVLFSKPGFSEEDLKKVIIRGDQLVGKLIKKNCEIVWLIVREDKLTKIEIDKINDVMSKTKIHMKSGSTEDSLTDSRALLIVSENNPGVSTQPTIIDIALGKENLNISS